MELSGTDDDDDMLIYSIQSEPEHGVLSGIAPAIVYTPNPSYTGLVISALVVTVSSPGPQIAPRLVII